MLQQVMKWDRELFLWLNSFHTPWLDPIMYALTKPVVWIPLYVLLAYFIFRHYKNDGWFVLLGVAVTILLADRITSGLMKPYFARLRPSHEPLLENLVHIVKGYRGGLFGFASGHAANTVGVAVVLWLVLREHYRWAPFVFLWATIMVYTRIYLGVHYPGDIIVGAIVGFVCGICGYAVYRLGHRRWHRRKGIS
jgi:undecaprenyl-diphosphatase